MRYIVPARSWSELKGGEMACPEGHIVPCLGCNASDQAWAGKLAGVQDYDGELRTLWENLYAASEAYNNCLASGFHAGVVRVGVAA